ncbi:hypothetical protein TNCV_3089871 [Trichonephila clavipes]|nr:hypothetical protein TNCV_3089871 [Trichonephila clavipes]
MGTYLKRNSISETRQRDIFLRLLITKGLQGCPRMPCKLGREVENIVSSHNYKGKHGWKVIGSIVCELETCSFLASGLDSVR